ATNSGLITSTPPTTSRNRLSSNSEPPNASFIQVMIETSVASGGVMNASTVVTAKTTRDTATSHARDSIPVVSGDWAKASVRSATSRQGTDAPPQSGIPAMFWHGSSVGCMGSSYRRMDGL